MTLLARALADRDASALPGRRDEAWRYSDLKGLVRAIPEASPPSGKDVGPAPLPVAADREMVVVNGVYPHGPAAHEQHAGETGVLRLRFVSDAVGTMHQCAFALAVREGASLTVVESYEGSGAAYLAHAALDIWVAEGASLERVVLVDEPEDAVSVSLAEVDLAPGARFSQTVLATGARLQRLETRVRHPGGGAQVRMDGVYLLGGARQSDLTSVVDHVAPDGATSQLAKGVVRDKARGVVQGRIAVRRGADRTDARMGCHTLLLDDGAEVDAKPELEIYADEVSCAHGATVGALDQDALFYMRQRGLPPAEARAMLMQAFVGEVIDRIGHDAVRRAAGEWTARRLEALA